MDMKERMKWEQNMKLDNFRHQNKFVKKGEILFTGSSLMEQFPINEMMLNRGIHKVIYNRGIGGFTTFDMLENMDEQILAVEPSKMFINIGTNDISMPDYKVEDLMSRYRAILSQVKERLPETKVYLMAYYPVNEVDKVPDNDWGKHMFDTRNNANIKLANAAVEELAKSLGYEYIDVNDGLTDERGMLKAEYTIEGVHMYADAYNVILDNMMQYL